VFRALLASSHSMLGNAGVSCAAFSSPFASRTRTFCWASAICRSACAAPSPVRPRFHLRELNLRLAVLLLDLSFCWADCASICSLACAICCSACICNLFGARLLWAALSLRFLLGALLVHVVVEARRQHARFRRSASLSAIGMSSARTRMSAPTCRDLRVLAELHQILGGFLTPCRVGRAGRDNHVILAARYVVPRLAVGQILLISTNFSTSSSSPSRRMTRSSE
jgi:hypothetical protein